MPQVALQIVGQRRDRSIAFARILLERFNNDRVQVALQQSAQFVGGGSAPGGVRSRFFAVGSFRGYDIGGTRRLGIDDCLHQFRRRAATFPSRVLSGQQHIQQHAEGIDVGGSRDGCARHLLRRRVLGRHRPAAFDRQQSRGAIFCFAFEQLGYSEIQQFRLPILADQHIGRLEVAMHDQVRVSVGHRTQHFEEKADSRFHIQFLPVAVAIDAVTLDIFENQIRLTRGRYPSIDKFRNVRMREPSKNAAFALETPFPAFPHQCDVDEFHRHSSLETSVVALRQPHASHSTLADLGEQSVWPQCLAREARGVRQPEPSLLQETFLGQHLVFLEEVCQLCEQGRVPLAQCAQPGGTLIVRHGQRLIQVWAYRQPLIRAQCRHRILRAMNPR